MFKRDVTGTLVFAKKLIIIAIGIAIYPILKWVNKTKFSGQENIPDGELTNTLFVSNHQTYFIDVMLIYVSIISRNYGCLGSLKSPSFILHPSSNIYFIAAQETMRSGIIPILLEMAGSVSIERTWRHAGEDVKKQVKLADFSNIGKALKNGWVITFPQGTTTPFVKGRRGTAHLIKKYKPTVIPVVIDGLNLAFERKSVKLNKKGVDISVRFKEPLKIDYEASSNDILDQVMDAIEQSEKYRDAKLGTINP